MTLKYAKLCSRENERIAKTTKTKQKQKQTDELNRNLCKLWNIFRYIQENYKWTPTSTHSHTFTFNQKPTTPKSVQKENYPFSIWQLLSLEKLRKIKPQYD